MVLVAIMAPMQRTAPVGAEAHNPIAVIDLIFPAAERRALVPVGQIGCEEFERVIKVSKARRLQAFSPDCFETPAFGHKMIGTHGHILTASGPFEMRKRFTSAIIEVCASMPDCINFTSQQFYTGNVCAKAVSFWVTNPESGATF